MSCLTLIFWIRILPEIQSDHTISVIAESPILSKGQNDVLKIV